MVFGLTNVLSIRFSKSVIHELDTITEYFVRLTSITSAIDVETFEFELNLRRSHTWGPVDPDSLARSVARQTELAKRLEQEFDQIAQLSMQQSRTRGTT